MADEVEQVEYQKVTPSAEPDALEGLGIENVKYRASIKRQVPTERGQKLEEAKQKVTTSQPYRFMEKTGEVTKTKVIPAAQSGIRGTAKETAEALRKYNEWRKKQGLKHKAVGSPAQQPATVGKRIAYINGKPVLVDKRVSVPRAPRPQVAYSQGRASVPVGVPMAPTSGAPSITEGMHAPNITQLEGQAPRILDMGGGDPRVLDSLQPGAHGRGFESFMQKGESGMLHMKKSGMFEGVGKEGEILGGAVTKGGFLESLKIGGKRWW